jgi:hypothetical protein
MNDVIGVMLDTAGLVTRGSDIARTEARRIIAERASSAAPCAQAPAGDPLPKSVRGAKRTARRLRGWLLGAWARPL